VVRQGIKTSKELERQVARIHELLERSNDVVTWDDHTPDPDNPGQLRQIDVTIRRDGQLTIIECRLSRNRQNVKWIEELIGRRQSLGAQDVTQRDVIVERFEIGESSIVHNNDRIATEIDLSSVELPPFISNPLL